MLALNHKNKHGAKMTLLDFWTWLETEREKRGMSYADIADRARERGYKIDRSGVFNAKKNNRKPSTLMLNAIASAFDMPVAEVMLQAGYLREVPKDLIDGRPSLLRVIENAQHMDDNELEILITLQKAMLAQKKRKRG